MDWCDPIGFATKGRPDWGNPIGFGQSGRPFVANPVGFGIFGRRIAFWVIFILEIVFLKGNEPIRFGRFYGDFFIKMKIMLKFLVLIFSHIFENGFDILKIV